MTDKLNKNDLEDHESKKNICKRFSSIKWHDSKLISLQLLPGGDNLHDELWLNVRLLTNTKESPYKYTSAKLILRNCTFIKLDIDLTFKNMCGGDISGAYCEHESPLRKEIEKRQIKNEMPLDQYLLFNITLIPPGGEIKVFAKNFELILEDNG